MKDMSAGEFLNGCRVLEILIRQRDRQLRELKEMAYSLGSPAPGERVQSSGKGTPKQLRQIEEIADMEADIQESKMELLRRKQKAVNIIQKINEPAYVILLEQRYVRAKSWKQVCKSLRQENKPYTDNHVRFKLNKQALKAFEKFYKVESK